jgi:hypothetical protein
MDQNLIMKNGELVAKGMVVGESDFYQKNWRTNQFWTLVVVLEVL